MKKFQNVNVTQRKVTEHKITSHNVKIVKNVKRMSIKNKRFLPKAGGLV